MSTVEDFCQFFESFAPLRLAEDWDNVGLLVGDRDQTVNTVMMASGLITAHATPSTVCL